MSNNKKFNRFEHLTYPHNCPYVRRLGEYASRVARFGIVGQTIRGHEVYLEIYHRDGTCPPTHDERGLPTTEWEDFIEIGSV